MSEQTPQTQPETGEGEQPPPELPRGVAGVAEILRRAQAVKQGDAPQVGELDIDQLPLQTGAPDTTPPADKAKAGKDDDDDDKTGLSEDGLGMKPTASEGQAPGDSIALAMQSLAEKAGLTLDELFDTEVPLGGELEATTLGKLKDQYQDYSKLQETKIAFEDQRTEFENDMIRSRAELQEIIGMLTAQGQIPQEMVVLAQNQLQNTKDKERAALLTIKPEWKDPAVFAVAMDDILETVGEYGFTRTDLESVLDHRLTKLLHDFHIMRGRFKDANAQRKRVVKQSRQKRANTAKAAPAKELQLMLDKAKSGTTADKVAAVSRLIHQ